ncbi:hypothetical protein FRC01_011079 [Tulasnella sp. 417]|nr:hypothetical protein FRC01_011079 [Tulasnella sp. 417]
MDFVTVTLLVLGLLFLACIAAFALRDEHTLPLYYQRRTHRAEPVMFVPPLPHPQLEQTIRTTQSAISTAIDYANESRHLGPLIRIVHTTISHARLIRIPALRRQPFAVMEERNTFRPATPPVPPRGPIEPPRAARMQNERSLGSELVLATSLDPIYLPTLDPAIEGTPAVAIASGGPYTQQQAETPSAPSMASQVTVH